MLKPTTWLLSVAVTTHAYATNAPSVLLHTTCIPLNDCNFVPSNSSACETNICSTAAPEELRLAAGPSTEFPYRDDKVGCSKCDDYCGGSQCDHALQTCDAVWVNHTHLVCENYTHEGHVAWIVLAALWLVVAIATILFPEQWLGPKPPEGYWFNCMDDANVCLRGCFCWPCLAGANSGRTPVPSNCRDCGCSQWGADCCIAFLVSYFGCAFCISANNREQAREMAKVKDGKFRRWCISFCFPACVTCQTARAGKRLWHREETPDPAEVNVVHFQPVEVHALRW